MKALKCPTCGRVRVGVPRRQRFCSQACARGRVLETLAANHRERSRKLRERIKDLSPLEAYQIGLHRGWNVGYRRAIAKAEGRNAS